MLGVSTLLVMGVGLTTIAGTGLVGTVFAALFVLHFFKKTKSDDNN